ncbi:MAG TPA: hypothetical protein VF952_01450 [Chloroflexia bacterium]|jgi:hypothetical protein
MIHNLLVTIIVPFVLLFLAAITEREVAQIKGRINGEKKFRVWKKEPSSSVPADVGIVQQALPQVGTNLTSRMGFAYEVESPPAGERRSLPEADPEVGCTLDQVCAFHRARELDDIDMMIEPELLDRNSLAINLVYGAFAIDVAYLFTVVTDAALIAGILVVHAVTTAGVRIYVKRSYLAMPKSSRRSSYATIAVYLGLISVAICAFGVQTAIGP